MAEISIPEADDLAGRFASQTASLLLMAKLFRYPLAQNCEITFEADVANTIEQNTIGSN